MGSIFNNGFGGKLPAITLSGGKYDGIYMDPDGIWPEGAYNSNPTYTYRDNLTKTSGGTIAVWRLFCCRSEK